MTVKELIVHLQAHEAIHPDMDVVVMDDYMGGMSKINRVDTVAGGDCVLIIKAMYQED